ncbi:uncharacterized protein LOC107982088 [Nasonia vitripennis]|uniref:Uncharacterized protein n=1 Tax=Nasonia vitripennis TaxID=7425 RepID=A0A7M7Q0E8_NASVI|nr:uncharacterized protein LOC107982088 [Nasonia vitripennis]
MWICTACLIMVILSMSNERSVDSLKNDLFASLVNRIVSDLKTNNVVLFGSKSARSYSDAFCNRLMPKVPTISIDLSKMMIDKDNRSLSLPILRHPTFSTLYVFLVNRDETGDYLKNLESTLNTTVRVSPISARPNCLIVCYSEETSSLDNWSNLLIYAWSLKFLDFTVAIVTPGESPILYDYNPFTKNFRKRLLAPRTDLFPYKLDNLHGYALKIPAIELQPYLYIKRNSEGEVVDLDGMSFKYCQIFRESLNFTTTFVTGMEHTVLHANFPPIFQRLGNAEIDMLSFPFNVRSIVYDFCDRLQLGRLFLNTNYVFIVPILPIAKIDIPLDVICFVPVFALIVVVYEAAQRLLRFPKKYWEVCKIFQILLGVTVPRPSPKKMVEKIVYFSLIMLSMKYSIDALTKIMDIRLLKGEVAFKSLEEIAESALPIYTLDFIIEQTYGNNDEEVIQKLKKKTFPVADIFQCIYRMVDNKSCMCITPHSAGAYVAKMFINEDGIVTTKVARPSLYDDMAAFAFERASPFARRFDELVQRIVESGISDSWDIAQQYTVKQSDFARRKPIKENIFLMQLYAVLSAGYVLGCLSLMAELACKRYCACSK